MTSSPRPPSAAFAHALASPRALVRTPLDELKTRARLLRKGPPGETSSDAADGHAAPRLRDCLHEVARAVGYADWEHARVVLGGTAEPGSDMGSFWHPPRSGILLNLWFARYDEAREALDRDAGAYLLPYRRQYVVVQGHFLPGIGFTGDEPAWSDAGRDLVASYATPAWQRLALQRLQAPRDSYSPARPRRKA